MNQNVSLVEALQALAAEMAKACSEAEAEAGLKRLRQLRTEFLGQENGDGAVNAARRNAEALIAWLETRLERLKLQLARKRRAQEGEVLEQLARQREAEGPSLLPTELVEAVVHVTDARDPEEVTSTAPTAEPTRADETAAKKKPSGREQEKAPDKAPKQTTPKPSASAEAKPAQATPEPPKPAQTTPKPPKPAQTTPEPPKPALTKPAAEKPEFTKYERLAAHLAASVGENSYFFEKLRKTARRDGPVQKAPADEKAAETHYRTVRDLGKRLVNLELHAKAIAKAKNNNEPISPLLKTAGRELRDFLRDFKTAKEADPEMAGEYERRFGGWADQFSAMKPEKGGAILELCRTERRPQQPTAEKELEREADVPQLVLKRDDDWQQ
jgi:hypothetical protein